MHYQKNVYVYRLVVQDYKSARGGAALALAGAGGRPWTDRRIEN